MASVEDIVLKHVAPGLGCVIAFCMFSSPFRAVQQVRKQKSLGDLNPLPMVAMWANCAAWLVYGYLVKDYYVFAANEPGLLLGTYMTIVCYGFADAKARDRMLYTVLFFTSILSVGGAVVNLSNMDPTTRNFVWGLITVGILLVYYGAPLTVLAEVVTSKSSSALYWPMSIMNTINGSLWVAYGLAVADRFIWMPNLLGAIFGGIQVALCMIYPNKPSTRTVDYNRLQTDELVA